eukprot:CAMPEP_0117668076 /NCGR_PEP_ID=MMETSP0804-20121206/11331_1 /TAXON_ID=1074897 /ORGANISM="Tetraselmis astigmatica, Strain CCMP880" /LENGTH=147 /DNA_ID=CAMNT_0005475893 /DNA_START=814 /DNA_END=1259 /DNA_ORIENTATION=-
MPASDNRVGEAVATLGYGRPLSAVQGWLDREAWGYFPYRRRRAYRRLLEGSEASVSRRGSEFLRGAASCSTRRSVSVAARHRAGRELETGASARSVSKRCPPLKGLCAESPGGGPAGGVPLSDEYSSQSVPELISWDSARAVVLGMV